MRGSGIAWTCNELEWCFEGRLVGLAYKCEQYVMTRKVLYAGDSGCDNGRKHSMRFSMYTHNNGRVITPIIIVM